MLTSAEINWAGCHRVYVVLYGVLEGLLKRQMMFVRLFAVLHAHPIKHGRITKDIAALSIQANEIHVGNEAVRVTLSITKLLGNTVRAEFAYLNTDLARAFRSKQAVGEAGWIKMSQFANTNWLLILGLNHERPTANRVEAERRFTDHVGTYMCL